MRIFYAISVLGLTLVLFSCSPNPLTTETDSKPTSQTIQIEQTNIPTLQNFETPKPSQTSTPHESIATNIFVQQCLPIQDTVSENISLSGYLIADTRIYDPTNQGNLFAINLLTTQQLPLLKIDETVNLHPNIYTISPDGKWFFYFEEKPDKGTQLFLGAPEEKSRPSAYWDSAWGNIAFWLNENQIFIIPNSSHNAIVLDPFTGKWQELNSEFPRPLNISYPFFYYNSTASQAVYISGDNYVLWDADSNTDIWIKSTYGPYIAPEWSSNGNYAAMIIRNEDINSRNTIDQLFLIDSKGSEELIVDFLSVFPNAINIKITSFKWSANNQYIALVLTTESQQDNVSNSTLLILDTLSKQITDLCIPVINPSYLVWSPDSNQLSLNAPVDLKGGSEPSPNNVSTVVVDIDQMVAVRLSNTPVVGWMK